MNRVGWLLMATAATLAGASVAAATFLGGKRAGGALAATEVAALGYRIHTIVAMRSSSC